MSRSSTPDRRAEFQRNEALESLLETLSDVIAPGGDRLAAVHETVQMPLVLVVGCPRSGTTVMMQWLADTGAFAVPTNLISRFHRAPAVGELVQQMLFDGRLDFRGELALDASDVTGGYRSDLGKTTGALAPNEFWYFWRRHFDFEGAPDDVDPVDTGDLEGFLRELAAWESRARRPIAMKAMIAVRHLAELLGALDRVVVVDVARDVEANVRSLMRARIAHTGTEQHWYSFLPRDGQRLRQLSSPEAQVRGQVEGLRRDIDRGLGVVADAQVVRVTLPSFLERPSRTWDDLSAALRHQGHGALPPYDGPPAIPAVSS